MIYTVTCNPALDYYLSMDELSVGCMNRVKGERIVAGGKGINVSRVLRNLGHSGVALGFVAGQIGNVITDMLHKEGISTDFVCLSEGNSRINVKCHVAGTETEINGAGPAVCDAGVSLFYEKLDALQEQDILVLSGSVLKGMSHTFYGDILKRLESRKIKTVVDTTKEALIYACRFHPFLVKPNRQELGEIFGVDIQTQKEAAIYGKKLILLGAQNVIVSMGDEGAILLTEDEKKYATGAIKGEAVSTIGAGDSLVAGFLAALLEGKDMRHAFFYGIATASASVFSKDLAQRQQVEMLYQQVEGMNGSDETDVDDLDAIVDMLDAYVLSGGSRMKIQTSDGLTQGQVKREYHHGRCDVNSPWALGTAFDVLEDEAK